VSGSEENSKAQAVFNSGAKHGLTDSSVTLIIDIYSTSSPLLLITAILRAKVMGSTMLHGNIVCQETNLFLEHGQRP
jgi:hypothetical protein